VATITINGVQVEAQDGRRLVEVIKEQGIRITNLCYIDGLDPYAGCRTCLVEIEGARPTPIQLSCSAQVAPGMVVRTDTPEVKRARQGVMSLIMANHPDRCLTCHRRVHCQPGEICLRDDVVTHRCLTCSKNYRCELQTSTELIDMGEFEEPWVGEARSYYETPPPEPDRANPFLEFDPQMCIICTRCVRACADLRHTGAITLAGKGSSTAIAFGTGGPVHESNCDFCGACIDVCPTATLMEKPNKWVALAEEWTNSACNGCAVGCTISYGTTAAASPAGGGVRPVIVRPDRLNPVSNDQICVRGRFGYDAVSERERLGRSLLRRGERLLPASLDDALAEAARALGAVRDAHGPGALAVLGSPLATNEEAYLLARLARDVIGTPHVDFAQGPLHRAVSGALRDALGVEQLPSTLTDLAQADCIVVVAGDLEESHPVAALRVKDAVVRRGARLVVVSSRWGELVPFAARWVQPAPGGEAAAVAALAADELLQAARADREQRVAVVFAPHPLGAADAGAQAAACATLAVALRGDEAAQVLHYLPTDANVLGVSDMGIAPGDGGLDFPGIIEAARAGRIRGLLVQGENPLLNSGGSAAIEEALGALDALVVIDSVRSTLAERAHVVLAEAPFFAEDGTITSADRRIVRQRPAGGPAREARRGLDLLVALAGALGTRFDYPDAAAVMAEARTRAPHYPEYASVQSGRTRALADAPQRGRRRGAPAAAAPESPAPGAGDGLRLLIGRSLYTSWEGATMRSPEADKLHREEAVWLHPQDAERLGVRAGDPVLLSAAGGELRIAARIDAGIAPGSAFVPQYYDGGAALALLPLDDGTVAPTVSVELRAPQPA
jgi:predicted molibdopterin-dependent oxidoreductase YjgC